MNAFPFDGFKNIIQYDYVNSNEQISDRQNGNKKTYQFEKQAHEIMFFFSPRLMNIIVVLLPHCIKCV